MSAKKVTDYIIVSRTEEYTSFSQRISDSIKTIETKIAEHELFISQQTEKVNKFEVLKQEFENLKSLKAEDTYDINNAFSMDNWIGGLKYKHPLAPYHPWKKVKTLTIEDIKSVNDNYIDIDQKLNEHLALDKKNKDELITLKAELKTLNSNPDPILNKNIRSNFEKDILNLINKGYVLQGSASSNKGRLYQAMVKYEDE